MRQALAHTSTAEERSATTQSPNEQTGATGERLTYFNTDDRIEAKTTQGRSLDGLFGFVIVEISVVRVQRCMSAGWWSGCKCLLAQHVTGM